MVSDTRSPYTLSIGLLAILELELISQTEEILHGVTAETPVDQVLGMKYHYSWQTVHGGSGKIVVIPHPDYVGSAVHDCAVAFETPAIASMAATIVL